MPFERPTLKQLRDQLVADMDAELESTDSRVRRSLLKAIATATAGALHLLYGFLAWIADQVFPDSAEDAGVVRWAAIWGVERADPVKATGTISIEGTAGTAVPQGTLWRSSARVDYASDAAGAIAADGTLDVAVTAVLAGAAGNAADGTKLRLVNAVAGLQSAAEANGALSGGANQESIESLRSRLVTRIKTPARGGTEPDYERWADDGHQDVTRVWVRETTPALGQVTVYFMTDDATDDGIPAAAVVTAVQDYIDGVRPVTADVIVAAPAPVELDLTIRNVVPDTAAVRAAIQAELQDLIRRESQPGGSILVSHIREAISTAAGETDHVLVMPVANVDHAANQIAVMGDITWTSS